MPQISQETHNPSSFPLLPLPAKGTAWFQVPRLSNANGSQLNPLIPTGLPTKHPAHYRIRRFAGCDAQVTVLLLRFLGFLSPPVAIRFTANPPPALLKTLELRIHRRRWKSATNPFWLIDTVNTIGRTRGMWCRSINSA